MTPRRTSRVVSSLLVFLAALGASLVAKAVELQNRKGLEDNFGRYAPGGDCKRQPQIRVRVSGLTFDAGGKQEKVTNPEQALVNGSPYKLCM